MQEKSFVDIKPVLGFRFGEFFTSPRVRPDGVLSSVLLWGYSFEFSCTERNRIVFSGGFCFSLHHLFLYACYLSWLLSLDFCCPSYIFLLNVVSLLSQFFFTHSQVEKMPNLQDYDRVICHCCLIFVFVI